MPRSTLIAGAVVIVALAGGAWWYMGMLERQGLTPTQALEKNPPAARTDTSDRALAQDEAAIDAQIHGFASDSSAINSSLNDQPVEQDY